MEKVRLTKTSGDKLIKILSTKGNRTERVIDGYVTKNVYPEIPTVGSPFGIHDETFSFRTSPVAEVLSENVFRTENSVYYWEKIK